MFAYFLYKLSHFFTVRLPLKACFAIATFFSILKFYISPRDRRAVKANLRIIMPQASKDEIHKTAKEVFINFGKYLIEFFRLSHLKKTDIGLWGADRDAKMKIKGIEYVDEALKNGNGVIILSAHMGNWELGGVSMSLIGYPMIAVALPHNHHRVNAFFNLQRERLGVEVVPSLGAAVKRIYSALKDNKIICLLGDRDFGIGGKRMDFLGSTKVIPRGPAVLAMRTGAAIIPGFVTWQEDDTSVLEFHKPIEVSGNEEDVMRRCTEVIEAKVRQHPRQWLLFREFWRE